LDHWRGCFSRRRRAGRAPLTNRSSGKDTGHILYDAHSSNPLLRFSMADEAGRGEKKAAESGLLERSLRVLA